ncbi:cytochrome c oxidase subunit II [Yoonia sp.]|uniref:cytochrome c oxidase subunit II n=1 Tax=Yoonia sp. TaxID=2212373 RepID=UPI00391B98C2
MLALNGCEGSTSTLQPAGPAAEVIATLWWVMFIGATLIFGLMMALLVLSFRARPQTGSARHQTRIWIVSLGLGFPVVVLLALLAYGLVVGERLLPRDDVAVVRVSAEASRWTWDFTYDDAPGLHTQNVLHIPAGRPIDVAITTADVIHSFWVPRLAGKLDAIPGRVNVLRIEADEPGRYQGLSAEFAGSGYDHFYFTVTAHDAAGWAAFIGGDAE